MQSGNVNMPCLKENLKQYVSFINTVIGSSQIHVKYSRTLKKLIYNNYYKVTSVLLNILVVN